MRLAWMALAGALGTLARYALAGLVQNAFGPSFPWGTAVVNVAGSLAFGIVWSALDVRLGTGELRVIVLVGFMGAFTTFSTWMFETVTLLEKGQYLAATGNVAGQTLLGMAALVLGMAIGRLL